MSKLSNANKIFTGESGAGKTSNFKGWMLPKLKQFAPVLILDPDGYDYADVADAKVEHPNQFLKGFRQGHRVMRWVPDYYEAKSDEAGKVVDKFIRGADRVLLEAEYMVIVIEEAHEFQRSNHIYSSLLERALRKYRGIGGIVVQLSQEPTDFASVSWSNSHDIFGFHMKDVPGKLEKLTSPGTDFTDLRQGEFYHISSNAFQSDRKLRPLSR